MLWVGTSGYNYPEWKGSFYPTDLAAAKMLPFYAARFPTVEINYTFYRMPTEKLVAGWAAQTPSPYQLTLKAPRRITHDSRLKDAGDSVERFCSVASTLGDKLGALLFQLPPFLRKDLPLLDAFLPHLKRLRRSRRRYILCGDWNIAHKAIDLKNWRANQRNSGFLPEERAWMDQLFGPAGYHDAFREVNPRPDQYTWWSNRGRAREKNVGWRIDYQVVSANLAGHARAARIYRAKRFSDHAPLTVDYEL